MRTLWAMRKALLIWVFVAACADDHKAYVECAGAPAGIMCTATHSEGSKPINVCWDVVIDCAGGLQTKAHACQMVQPMGKASKLVPEADFADISACTQATGISVVDLKLTVAD